MTSGVTGVARIPCRRMTKCDQRQRFSRLIGPLLAIAVMTASIAGCGSSAAPAGKAVSGTSTTVHSAPAELAPPSPIVWSTCTADKMLQCGTVSVPVDYANLRDGFISLAVARAPALDAPGSDPTMLFNPGGPGESGNQILPVAILSLPPTVRQHYNVVSFDPRGTGASDPLQCGTSPSSVISALPIPTASGQPLPGTPVFDAMAQACQARAALTEPFINTIDTARDMDRIRQALGLPTISYYGMSYGTVLGAVYADLFPHRIAYMVLDGAVDVNATLTQQAEEEAPAEEESLLHLFAACHAQPTCPLGDDPEASFVRLATSLTDHPLPAPGDGDTSPVTVGDLDTATLFALSVPDFTTAFYQALTAAEHGNGVPLRGLALSFVRNIDGTALVDALWAITCNDAAVHPGAVEAGDLARTLNSEYPLIGGYSVTLTLGGCVSWPQARQPVTDLHPSSAPPVLVISNTGDPNTPIIEGRHLAAIFPTATLLTWRGWGHTWLLSGSGDVCMQRYVTRYLTGGGLPPAGTICD
jgi:pimeloyl-ACP methyl ester carboxylesterase